MSARGEAGGRVAPRRVVVTGPECTGKTTLAGHLAARWGVSCVAEQARVYAESRGRPLHVADVEPIALRQLAAQAHAQLRAERAAAGLLVLDTDLVSTVVYARHYYGSCPAWIEAEAARRRGDLYLLHLQDVPWVVEPGIRESEDRRGDQLLLFRAALERPAALGARVVEIGGSWDEREATAVAAIEALLAARVGDHHELQLVER